MRKVKALARGDLPLVVPLLQSFRYHPYRAYENEFGSAAASRLFVATVRDRLSSAGSRAFCVPEGEAIRGLASWSGLAEESRYLGWPAARIDCLIADGDYSRQRETQAALLERLLADCAAAGVRHLSVRVDAGDAAGQHALAGEGFVAVDGLLTYLRDLQGSPWPAPDEREVEVRPAAPADLPRLKDMARSVYLYDRLHADPAIPGAVADELHAVWVERSCSGRGGDAVHVAVEGGVILGYSVCRVDRAAQAHLGEPVGIWVIAGTAAQARGRGVARSLCYAMLDWQKAQGVRVVQGGTQAANMASARLHESCGFRIAGASVSMRRVW